MYVATGGPNVKWGGTDFKWGGRAPLSPQLATALVSIHHKMCFCTIIDQRCLSVNMIFLIPCNCVQPDVLHLGRYFRVISVLWSLYSCFQFETRAPSRAIAVRSNKVWKSRIFIKKLDFKLHNCLYFCLSERLEKLTDYIRLSQKYHR